MAGAAKLVIGNLNADVIDFNYSLSIGTDNMGKPMGIPRSGLINVQISSTKDTSLMEWLVATKTPKDGMIKVYAETATNSTMRIINFNEARIVGYSERYSNGAGSNTNMTISFSISAKKLSIGKAIVENPWTKDV